MDKVKAYLNTLSETVVMTKKEHCLLVLTAALAGCIAGMLISPKKTICCSYEDDWEDED